MSFISIKIQTEILHIIVKKSFDNFTVRQVKDELLRSSNVSRCPNQTRKFVYRQIIRLVKFELLSINGAKYSHDLRYVKTKLFEKVAFIENTQSLKFTEDGNNKTDKSLDFKEIKMQLESEIRKSEEDMVSVIGEGNEYMRLIKIFPNMKQQLKQKHMAARNEGARIQGKINALNNILHSDLK